MYLPNCFTAHHLMKDINGSTLFSLQYIKTCIETKTTPFSTSISFSKFLSICNFIPSSNMKIMISEISSWDLQQMNNKCQRLYAIIIISITLIETFLFVGIVFVVYPINLYTVVIQNQNEKVNNTRNVLNLCLLFYEMYPQTC